jgi:hypothetical protein
MRAQNHIRVRAQNLPVGETDRTKLRLAHR